jgi:hypothetical protein
MSQAGWDRMRFNHAAENSVQLKTYDLFISGIFQLMFWDYVCGTTEIAESKTVAKRNDYI